MEEADLHVLDWSEIDGVSRDNLREKLCSALTSTGFFFLKGIKGYESQELLKITQYFFNLPLKEKMSITKKMFDPDSQFSYRGYFPAQKEEISYKEGFEIGPDNQLNNANPNLSAEERILLEVNQWPKSDVSKIFQHTLQRYYEMLTTVGLELMKLIEEIWDLPQKTLTSLFEPTHLSTFRLLHYPPREGKAPEEAIDGESVLQCSEHRDSGIFTLLSTFDYDGLQIRNENNKWVNVPKMKDCLVVNIGELLALISGGSFKATNHRVVDTGRDRFSVPFFLEPSFHANVNMRLPPINKKSTSKNFKTSYSSQEIVHYGSWVIQKMKSFAEFKYLLI